MEKKMENEMETGLYKVYCLESKLLKGGYIGDCVGDHYKGYSGGH